jgi:hypothetical protein
MAPIPSLSAVLTFLALAGIPAGDPGADQVFFPGVVSTAAAEVRLAFSPDGQWLAWGAIGRADGPEQQDIWIARKQADGWGAPARADFDSAAVEFDPAFSQDGQRLYFHSDRPGGSGGTDIWHAGFDPKTGAFSEPVNAGAAVNSEGDEWAPTPTADGGLLFASDGWGGAGRHDLLLTRTGALGPENLGSGVNGPDEDFDGVLSADGRVLIFSSGRMGDDGAEVTLYFTRKRDDGWSARTAFPLGCSGFLIGSSLKPGDLDTLYYSANCKDGLGRMDMRSAPIGNLLRR